MAAKRQSQDPDLIARLADAGEDALRELVALPRRILVGAVHRVEGRLHQTADSVRGIDRLDKRVAELEKRVNSLAKPASTRRRSTSSSSTRRKKAQTAAPVVAAEAGEDADRTDARSAPSGPAAEGRPETYPGAGAETPS
jgi:hypothetical protein